MRLQSLCFILLFLLTACVSHRTNEALSLAESKIADSPDSSLVILNQIPRKALCTRSIRARHALLTTAAQDKCYINVVEDSTICVAYNWYKHHGSKVDNLMSTYYRGVVLQNGGENTEAIILFREAELKAKELRAYRTLSLAEQHLNAIFAKNYDRIRALSYAEKSLESAVLARDSLMADYCRLDIADQYIAYDRFSESEELLRNILNTRKESSPLFSYVHCSLAKALLLKQIPDYVGARASYEYVLNEQAIPLSLQDYCFLAILSEEEGDRDKAEYYSAMAGESVKTQKDSAIFWDLKRLRLDFRGDYKQAYEALKRSSSLQNEVVSHLLERSLTHAMEDYYNDRIALEAERNKSRIYLSGLILIVLLTIIVGLYMQNRKNKQRILKDMATIQEFSADLQRQRNRNSAYSEVIDTFVENKVLSLKELSEAYYSWGNESVRLREKKKGRETKEEVIATFRAQLGELRDNKDFLASLEKALNLTKDNVMIRVRELLKNHRNVDYELLVMFFTGISINSICYLRNMTEVAVRMRKTRLKQLFESFPDHQGDEFADLLAY